MSKRNKHKEQETKKKLDTQHEEMDAGTVMDDKKVEEQAAATDNQPEPQGEAPTTDPLAEAQAQIEELKDRYLRTVAEFENFKRRTQKEKAELIFNGSEKTVSAILPILDDMERAAVNANKTDDIHALEEGWELIFKKLLKTLEGLGVKKIETQDKAFDVDFHEAVAMVPNVEDDKKGKVIDCVQTGYTLNEKVIRHAKVAVGQ